MEERLEEVFKLLNEARRISGLARRSVESEDLWTGEGQSKRGEAMQAFDDRLMVCVDELKRIQQHFYVYGVPE